MTVRVGIINVTGFAGMEAARLLWNHPEAELVAATGRSLAGQKLGEAFPHLAAYAGFPITSELETEVDVVVLGAAHGRQRRGLRPPRRTGPARHRHRRRLPPARGREAFAQWFGKEHPAPGLLDRAVYGLSELYAPEIGEADLVANPGCYPAATILALAPAVDAGIIEPRVFVDAKSGISGAGRGHGRRFQLQRRQRGRLRLPHCQPQHQPEMAQDTLAADEGPDVAVTFVPHLVPMTRGIHSTCYAPLAENVSQSDVLGIYRDFYADAPSPRLRTHLRIPSTPTAVTTASCIPPWTNATARSWPWACSTPHERSCRKRHREHEPHVRLAPRGLASTARPSIRDHRVRPHRQPHQPRRIPRGRRLRRHQDVRRGQARHRHPRLRPPRGGGGCLHPQPPPLRQRRCEPRAVWRRRVGKRWW